MTETTQAITHKAIKSTKWVFLSTILSKAWQPIVTIILARLLVPQDFGLMAIATITTNFMAMFQDVGLSSALIQRKDKIEEAATVVFWTNIGLGTALYFLIFISAPYIATFFNTAGVSKILRVMGLLFLISPLRSVQITLLSKELEFKRLFYYNLVPAIIPGIISITLAYLGHGVWALVYGSLISSVMHVLTIWLAIQWRPRFEYDVSLLKELIGFGGFVSIESFLGWGITQIDNLFVGKFLGARQLGIYSLGWNIGFWPLQNILYPLTGIFYPMFSSFKGDLAVIRRNYLKILELMSLVLFPLGALIAMTAHLFIPVLLGPKWIDVIPVIQIFSIFGILAAIVSINPHVYKAIGRPDIMPKFMMARVIISVPVYYFTSQQGILPLCIAHLILVLFFVPINTYISLKVLNISVLELFNKLYAAISSTVIMAIAGIFLLMITKKVLIASNILTIMMVITFSAIVYIPLLYFGRRQTFFEMKKLLGEAIF